MKGERWQKPGFVYILSSPKKPGLLKIGSSLNPWNRRTGVQDACDVMHDVVANDQQPFLHYRQVEKPVRTELSNFNERLYCQSCMQTHREPFRIDEETAKGIVRRWVTYVHREPYQRSTGQLKPFWNNRIDAVALSSNHGQYDDHDARHDRWQNIVNVGWHDWVEHWVLGELARNFWHFTSTHRWQV